MDLSTTTLTVGEPPNLSVILTIRLLMQGKEVGSIIGKRGDHIKVIRDESGAKINISDGSCPERIVTITGNLETITKAFTMICHKFEDDMTQLPNSVPKPPITFRLIVPATQCGSLIGKGGTKIKEIREATGASIQVASEMLPNSTERAVTISGTANAIIQCMYQICHILLDSPPKGATISYRPKPSINPLLLATSAAAAAAAQQPILQPATAFYGGQLAASELTKIHPFNPLLQPLPGFNPTVLGTTAGTYSPSLIHWQTSQPLLQTTADMALAANGLNGSYARTLDARTLNNAASRDEAQKMNMAAQAGLDMGGGGATNLSQYLINTSTGATNGTIMAAAAAAADPSTQDNAGYTNGINDGINGISTATGTTISPTYCTVGSNQYLTNLMHLMQQVPTIQQQHQQHQQNCQQIQQLHQQQQIPPPPPTHHQILLPYAAAMNHCAPTALTMLQHSQAAKQLSSSVSPGDRLARRFCPY